MLDNEKKRSLFNTTIDAEILSDFRKYCKNIGCPMNLPVEAFMRQFADGKFVFELGKNGKMTVDLED